MSELRKGYTYVEDWIREGMQPPANIAFTEGDLRLAAQLVEYAKQINDEIQAKELDKLLSEFKPYY